MAALTATRYALRKSLSRLRNFELAFFLIICFILGGTSQDIVAPKLPIYLLSLFFIGWRARLIEHDSPLWTLKAVLILFGSLFCFSAAYLLPLPPSIWSALPGRDVVVEGYQLADITLPWLPLTFTPETTLFSLFDFLPPLALIILVGTRKRSKEIKHALIAIAFFTITIACLAALQMSHTSSSLYFYELSNRDAGVGFFSNANHFGIFLILTLPFLAALASMNENSKGGKKLWIQVLCFLAAAAAMIGVSFSGSLASYLLIGPVLMACFYIWSPSMKAKKMALLLFLGAVVIAALADFFIFKIVSPQLINTFGMAGDDSRQVMRATALEAARDVFPIGSGLGSFADTYRLFEGFGKRTVPHAHNEYFELFVELGLFGLIWLAAFLTFIARLIWKAFKSPAKKSRLAKFMAIVLGTLAVHCTVDYAPRTIAVMVLAMFALCLILAPPRRG